MLRAIYNNDVPVTIDTLKAYVERHPDRAGRAPSSAGA